MMHAGSSPIVSVCIQTYQHVNYIKDCLDSVLAQRTDFPFEIIVGEDDSTDGTREICQQYAIVNPGLIHLFLRSEKDRIYIKGEKTGRFNLINNLAAATGKYIAMLDGDDYWTDPEKLQQQVEFMERHPGCSVSHHKTAWQKGKGRVYTRGLQGWPATESVYSLADFLCSYNNIVTSTTMFQRENINDLPSWFLEVPLLDFPLHVHNGQKGNIGFLSGSMAVHRFHRGGMWSGMSWQKQLSKLWHLYTIMSRHYEGDLGAVMLLKRYETGLTLIRFFKNHSWENRSWYNHEFLADLEKDEFRQDKELLHLYQASLTAKNYLLNGLNAGKALGRFILKRN